LLLAIGDLEAARRIPCIWGWLTILLVKKYHKLSFSIILGVRIFLALGSSPSPSLTPPFLRCGGCTEAEVKNLRVRALTDSKDDKDDHKGGDYG